MFDTHGHITLLNGTMLSTHRAMSLMKSDGEKVQTNETSYFYDVQHTQEATLLDACNEMFSVFPQDHFFTKENVDTWIFHHPDLATIVPQGQR